MKHKHISSLSREQREKIRFRAGKLFEKGISQSDIAKKFRVTPAAVSYWHQAWKRQGKAGLKSKGKPGFPSRLTLEKRKIFRAAILKGPQKYAFETNLWTLSRLAMVMKQVTGVKLSRNRTWEIVRSLGFTCQKPQVRAKQRDEQAIKAWKEKKLPGLKKMGANASIFSGL